MRVVATPLDLQTEPPADWPRVLESADAPADPVALARLREGVAGADLAAPPIVLPDFHLKDDKEMPSSVAVATQQTIRSTLTSSSVNCGMALVALTCGRPSQRAIAAFYRRVRERNPFPPTYRRDLSPAEVVECAAGGARYAADRFDVDPAELSSIEEGGRLDVEPFGGVDRVRRELPWSVKQLSRIRFATIGKRNHFIELQEVDEVFDHETARILGLHAGQVTLQFHGGGGSLPGEIGLLFGRRKRYPLPVRAQMAVQKPLYHLGRARSLAELRQRKRLYFSSGCPPVERDGREGERLLLANAMAMNYGFAFRLAAYARLRTSLRETLGDVETRLVVDSPHNSIYEEELNGKSVIVHRHNASRAFPARRLRDHPVFGITGQPILLPGTHRTSSFLCVAADGADASLFSTSHGGGTNVARFVAAGLSGSDPKGRTTLSFDYSDAEPVETPQFDDRGIDDVLTVLVRGGIVRPVARLRPFAVLR
jgi:tRNA-splicing ligase RtcB